MRSVTRKGAASATKKGLFFVIIAAVLLAACTNDQSSGNSVAGSGTANGADTGNKADLLEDRYFYEVEITKTKLQDIIREIGGGSPKRKLLFQFSCPNVMDAKSYFDLAVYGAKDHKHYAEDGVPFIAKATNPSKLKILPRQQYILGNNEKLVDEIEEILRLPGTTKIIFSPILDSKNQLLYITLPSNDSRPLVSLDTVDFNKARLLKLLTNPSPPAKPAGVEQ